MRIPRVARRICLSASLLLLCGSKWCSDQSSAYHCNLDVDDDWSISNLYFEVDEPRHCPYTVAATGNPVSMSVFIGAPSTDYLYQEYDYVVFNLIGGAHPTTATYQGFYRTSPTYCGSAPACATVTGSFPGVTATNSSHYSQDSIQFWSWTTAGIGNAWDSMGGYISGQPAAAVAGPTSILAGTQGSWNASMTYDTLSFLYQWQNGGQNIANGTARTYTKAYDLAGSYPMSTIVTRSDRTADTLNYRVDVSLNVSISGPGVLCVGDVGNYSTSVYGASGGVSYQWYEEMVPQGTGPTYSTYAAVCGAKRLHVDVTDDAGHSGAADFDVNVEPAPGMNCD